MELRASRREKLARFLVRYALYMLILGLVVTYASLTPLFLSAQNIRSLLTNSASLLTAAVGMTFVLLIAEIDLSVGTIGGVCAAIWILMLTRTGMNVFAVTVLAVLLGALIGGVNAALIVGAKINSFLVTMGMQIFLRGFVFIFTNGAQILMTSQVKEVNAALKGAFFGLSPLLVFSVLLAAMMVLVYRYSAFGRRVQAIGCNRKAAEKIGVNVRWTSAACYMLSGAFGGLAGIFSATNVGMVHPANICNGLEFLAITACVLGGTSLKGGFGTIVPGTLVGVVFLNSIENGLGLLGANAYAYPVVRGVVIYLAMLTDSLKRSLSLTK
ncbi:MAG: ABC transporter permease [Clostridiales bacterium]|nr:ABC transporter permease [Clostridiales bacterium]